MSLTYNLFKTHALAALESNDSAAALQIVNDPVGRDLTGTEVDQLRVWPWFRDQVGNEAAIVVRSTVEAIIAAKPANPATDPTAYAFAVNAQSLLTRLDGVGISPCDSELRRALTTIIQTSSDQPVIEAFTDVLMLGYQSLSEALLQRVATAEDFEEARQQHQAAQVAIEPADFDRTQLVLSVNRRHDERTTVSCRSTPVAIVDGVAVKGEAVGFDSSQKDLKPAQQQLVDSVLAAVTVYVEGVQNG